MQPIFKDLLSRSTFPSKLLWGLLWGCFLLIIFLQWGISLPSIFTSLIGSLAFAAKFISKSDSQISAEPLRFSLLNEIQADVVVLDHKGKIVFVNDFSIPSHINKELAIGKTLLEYGEAVGRESLVSQMREEAIRIAIEYGKEFEWEESIEDKDKVRDYIRRVTPVYEDKRLKNLIVYGLEITDRKAAEKEAASRAAIQRTINYFSNSLFKLNTEEDVLWDIAKNCIRELDFVDAVIYTLDRERQVLVQRAAYGNKEDGEFAIYEPIEIPLGKGIVGSVALKGVAELVLDTSLDDRYILDDEARLSELAVPIIGPEGVLGVIDSEHPKRNFFTEEHLSILTIIANIAANKIVRARVVEALEKAKVKAEQATEAKSNFLSSMSHEIRTPLNAVIGLSHLLNDEVKEPKHKDSLRTLLSSAEHLLALINDILDFSKIEEGKLILNKTSFSLSGLVEDIANPFRFLAEEKLLAFHVVKPEEDLKDLIGDDTRLKQILTNLIGNALKFTREGAITLSCKLLSQTAEACSLRFAVKDTGVGIANERRASIFERFIQAEDNTSRNFGGTGLGLSISKKLVEMQGGKMGLESNDDPQLGPTGTTFWFEIDYPFSQEKKKASNLPKTLIHNLTSLQGLKVLLVEDNLVNVKVARRFLEKWQVAVTHAENGLLATQMLAESEYDLILMDLNMPVMGGLEATSIIRNTGNQIPIIALTADATAEVREKVFEQKMNGYLTKPFKPADLNQTLAEYLPLKKENPV